MYELKRDKLTHDNVAKCSSQLYSSHDIVAQDAALLNYFQISKPKWCRVEDGVRNCFHKMDVSCATLVKIIMVSS